MNISGVSGVDPSSRERDRSPLRRYLDANKATKEPLPKILQTRELYGKSMQMKHLNIQIDRDKLQLSRPVLVNGRELTSERDFRILTLLDDSRRVIGMAYPKDEDELTEFHFFIFGVSRHFLTPEFALTFTRRSETVELFAKYPRDCSFITIVCLTDYFEFDMSHNDGMRATTIASIKFVLFTHAIEISMSTFPVLSFRWKKFPRSLLRQTDNGAVLCGGPMLVSYFFSKNCPPLKPPDFSRTVYQVIDIAKVDPDGTEPSAHAFYAQGIVAVDAVAPYPGFKPRSYHLKKITETDFEAQTENPSHGGLREPLFFTETALNIEDLLHTELPDMLKRRNMRFFLSLIDYEVDLFISDTDSNVVFVLISSVVAAARNFNILSTTAPYIVTLHVVWNVFEGTQEIHDWKDVREISWELADNPAKWYVFRSTECECSDVDGDVRPFKRVVKGEKFKYITVPLPGITLYKRRTQSQDDAS